MSTDWVGIILAAGRGVRMRSRIPKALHPVCGQPLMSHAANSMRDAGVERLVAVISEAMTSLPEVGAALGPNVALAVQARQLGTADALLAARDSASGASSILVGAGDMALVKHETVKAMLAAHAESHSAVTLLTADVDAPFGLGRVIRDYAGLPLRIVEEVDADAESRQITEVNTSWYCFDAAWLWERIGQVSESASGERYLTSLIEAAAVDGGIGAVSVSDPTEAMGVNDRSQLAAVEGAMRARINAALMRSGVTMTDPASTYVDAGITVGADTTLLPGTRLTGRTSIGERCDIGPQSTISDSNLGDDVQVTSSFVEGASVDSDVTIGPYGHLRPGTVVERGARIGNHAEIKNSRIGSGTHIGHFSYIGDATLGKNVNIGAGAVTANFDGLQKHSTAIGDSVLIGSGTIIVAPVSIGSHATTGAGAVVTSDVASGDTVVGVPARPMPRNRSTRSKNQ